MTPLDFLTLLWQHKPPDHYMLIWSRDDKRSHWFRDVVAAASFVVGMPGRDVYVGVGVAGREYGPTLRCPSSEITGVTGFWADFDLKSDAHNKKALPCTVAEALEIIPDCLPPSIVILTGNGVHVWWLFKEPWIFHSEDERKRAAALSSQFHTLLQYRSTQLGWAYERLSDLARVLRIPGTINAKDSSNPKNVTVFSSSDQRYDPSGFQQYIGGFSLEGSAGVEAASSTLTERLTDSSLAIDLNARVPEETLSQWMTEDARFRETWFRQRTDLNDQSQSGYDMALASFGVKRGIPEQQIVDLIVHHRAVHKEKARTRWDYFQRTLAKAASSEHRGDRSLRPFPGECTIDPESGAAPEPLITKAQLCEKLSELLGIRILRVVKITGKNPVYRMELESGKIEFPNVGKLLGQHSLRMAIAAETNHYLQKHNPKRWEQIAQRLLDALTEQDGGEEMQLEGSARMYVTQYLSDSGALIQSLEGLRGQSARRPMLYKGEIAVCASDMLLYVNKSMSQNLTLPTVTGMLSVLGAKHVRIRGKFPEQGRWCLPIEKFDPAEYEGQLEDYGSQSNN